MVSITHAAISGNIFEAEADFDEVNGASVCIQTRRSIPVVPFNEFSEYVDKARDELVSIESHVKSIIESNEFEARFRCKNMEEK